MGTVRGDSGCFCATVAGQPYSVEYQIAMTVPLSS